MRKLILGLIAIILISSTQAQESGELSGSITDQKGLTLEAITVTLRKASDSMVLRSLASNKLGQYRFRNIPKGTYLIEFSGVGFNNFYSGKFEVTANIMMPPVKLESSSRSLAAVTVSSKKPFIEQKIDRTVVNVDAAVTNTGTTALELLEKSPGVSVDKDGNISLKGKQNVMVMVDGRPTYLSQADLANYLKSLSSSSIDQIEIMTNPSAKYDAAGNSGIINIKTKKNKQKGMNGSLTLGYSQGIYWRTNNSFNLNYRIGKFNFFTNGSYNRYNNFQQLDIDRTYLNSGTKEVNAKFSQVSKMYGSNDNYNLKLGTDYFLNKSTTLGFVTSGFINPESHFNDGLGYMKDPFSTVDSVIHGVSRDNNRWKNGSVNLNMRHQFDTLGTELDVDLDYVNYRSNNHQVFTNTTQYADGKPSYIEMLQAQMPLSIDIYTAKADYSKTLGKALKLEAGFKTGYVKTDNAANYEQLLNQTWSVDESKTNRFFYKENINAAYVNLNKQVKKFGFQLGLRYENTHYTGYQYKQDSTLTRTYGSLFPTSFISYAANKNNQFGLSYGRRIDRPAYQDLNPFLFFLDKFTYESGNPYLRPQFSDNIELTHTFKGWLTTTLNYSYTKDLFQETFEQSGYAAIVRQGNIGKRNNAGIAITAQIPVAKWWTAIVYSNLNYTKYEGVLYGEQLSVDATNIFANINNQFRFGKGWSAELSGFYRTRGIEGQVVVDPFGQVSSGVSKSVLKGKGTVKFNVRDMFRTQVVHGSINFQTTQATFINSRDSRMGSVSFVYRFGKQIKGLQPRKNIGGANEEQNRVKAGGN